MTDKITDFKQAQREKQKQSLLDQLAELRGSKPAKLSREIKDAKTEAHFKAKERL